MDFNYDEVLDYSFKVACKYIKDKDKAQDIAQLTAIQLFINNDRIDPAKLDNWLYTVTKNFCFKQFKISKKNKEYTFEPNIMENMNSEEFENAEYKLDFYSYDFIPKADQGLLDKYYNDHFKISELSRTYKIKKKRLKDKIYKLSQEIILFKKMKGHEFSYSISGTKLHNSIYYFLGKFVKALNENKLTEFSKTMKDCVINDSINDIEIKTVRKITVDFFAEDHYKGLVVYRNFLDELKVFLFNFIIIDKGKIRIIEFPVLPEYVVSHSKEKIPDELKKAQKVDKHGRAPVSDELIKDLVKQNKIKVLQARKGYFKD